MVAANDKAHSQIEGLVEAADQLASNVFVMGSHHLTLTVFADTMPALDRVVAQARSDLADSGAVVAREDLGLEAAFWSQLPGNARLRTRPGRDQQPKLGRPVPAARLPKRAGEGPLG